MILQINLNDFFFCLFCQSNTILFLVANYFFSFFRAGNIHEGFPGGRVVKNPPANTGDSRDAGSIPGSGRSPGVENGYHCSIQYGVYF